MQTGNFETLWEKICEFDGWLTEQQARRLWNHAQEAPGNRFVEIGSHHGKSTAVMASARPRAVLLAIDPWDDPRWGGGKDSFKRFQQNLTLVGCLDNVEVYHGLSSEAHRSVGSREFDFVYVDGAHDFMTARADIQSWGSRISPRGFVAIHDCYSSIGVTKALFASLFTNRNWRYRGCTRSLAIFQQIRDSLPLWTFSRLRMAARLCWFARNLVVKFANRRGWTLAANFLGHYDRCDPF